MGSRRRLRRIVPASVTVAGIVVIIALASGEVSLVTTHGVSMAPRFHTGDLAVIVPASSYHVGEIVGYRSPLLHVTVLHRIVAVHGGLFTFKGDNNDFVDPLKLPASYIEGRLWLHVPQGGMVLGWFRSPFALGFLAFVVVALGITSGVSRRQRAAAPRPGTSGPKHATGGEGGAPWWRVAVPLALALVWAVLGAVAWTRPTTRASTRPVTYAQHVSFGYSASAPAGAAYPTGAVGTGDPVFLRLVQSLDIEAEYSFTDTTSGVRSSSVPGTTRALVVPRVTGTIGAVAMLEGPGGWTGTLADAAPVPFSGSTARVDLPLDLSRMAALEKQFTAETGVSIGGTDIVVTPTVHVRAAMDGTVVSATDAPPLRFQVSGEELGLAVPAGSEDSGTGTSSASSAALEPTARGAVELPSTAPARLAILGRTLSVASARALAGAALALSVLAVLAGWSSLVRRRRMDEADRIRARHGHDMVAVTTSPAADARLVVELESFGALARLARRYDCLILALAHDEGHAYYVECGATIYRFGPEPTPAEPEPPTLRVEVPPRPSDLTYFVTSLPSAS